MIDPQQMMLYVIAPTLTRIAPTLPQTTLDSLGARRLMLATGMVESGYQFIHQNGTGPALGFWQMEPFTHDDCWDNYIKYHSNLGLALLSMTTCRGNRPDASEMMFNMRYACAMARLKYLRLETPFGARPAMPIPNPDDSAAMANLWVNGYNAGGAGTPAKFLKAWGQVGLPLKAAA